MGNSVPLAEIVEELENGSRPEGGVDNSGDVFSVGGEHLNDFGGFDFSSVKMISHDFYNKMNRGKVKPDDVIIVKDGATTGKTSFVNDQFPYFPCAINEHVFRLAVKQEIADPQYIFYYLYSPKGNKEILDDFRGATVGGISQDFVNKVFVPLPPLTEQKRIASLLARADRLRQLRRTAHDLGDALLQSVFLEMFGDPIEDSHKWQKEALIDIINPKRPITYGILMPGENLPNGVPYVRVVDIWDGQIDIANVRRTSNEIDEQYKRSRLLPQDLLLTIRGQVGRLATVPSELSGANITQDTARLAPIKSKCNVFYLQICLSMPSFQRLMQSLTRGVAVTGINLGDVKELPIPLPPLSLQEEFASVVRRVESLRGRMSEAERQVEGLFESLLAEAFDGHA